MATVARHLQFGAVVWLACNGLWACGEVQGARYTIDGVGVVPGTTAPPSDMTLRLSSWWSEAGLSLEPGGESGVVARVSVAVGPWAPTSDPSTYEFTVVAEVGVPGDGDEPTGAILYLAAPDGSGSWSPHAQQQEVGDDEDGWIPVHIVASFDLSSPY